MGQVSGRGAGEQLRSSLFQGCHLGPQAVQFAIYLRKRRLRLSFLQVVAPTCCLDECLNLRSEKAQPGIAVDGTLSVLQLAVADRLDDLVLSESELGASSLVAQGGALASPLGFEAVDDSPLPRNGLGNGAAGDDMVSDCAGCVESGTNRGRLCGLALAVGVGESRGTSAAFTTYSTAVRPGTAWRATCSTATAASSASNYQVGQENQLDTARHHAQHL